MDCLQSRRFVRSPRPSGSAGGAAHPLHSRRGTGQYGLSGPPRPAPAVGEPPSHRREGAALDPVLEFEAALLALDRVRLGALLTQPGTAADPLALLERLVVPALERIGAAWEAGRLALSQVYMSGRLCEDLVNSLLPPAETLRANQPRMAIAVLDDYHLLGKRLVYSAVRASGYPLQDFGRADLDGLVSRVRSEGTDILLVSVLMLHSALRVRELRDRLDAAGVRTRLIVGGAPFRFDDALWQEVGADAMGRSAADAIGLVRRFSGAAA